MEFSRRQADPRKHVAGLVFVILFHVLIVYALATGLATKVIEVVMTPVEIKVLAEVRRPRPPPAALVPPPPRLETPPPAMIAPPDVQIALPPTPPPPPPRPDSIAVTPAPVQTPPIAAAAPVAPAPVVVAPPAPPAPPAAPATLAAPPVAAAPRPTSAEPIAAEIACSKMPLPIPPPVNVKVQGSLFVVATVKDGQIVDVRFLRDRLRGVTITTKRLFREAIETAMRGYVCAGDATEISQEFFFEVK